MRHAATLWPAVLGILLSSAAWPGSARAADQRAASCIGIEERGEEPERRLSLRVTNSCTRSVRCTVSWRVSCDPGESREYQEATTVGAGAAALFRPSAGLCEADAAYEIAAVKWACTQPPVTTARPPRGSGRSGRRP